MAFALATRHQPVVEMNITPLVDVMLVLLIIFMVTMPQRTYSLTVDLPQTDVNPLPQPPAKPIALHIDASGQLTWNGSALPMDALEGAMKVEAARYASPKDQPLIQIESDPEANYGSLATVISATKNAGMTRIGFVDNGSR